MFLLFSILILSLYYLNDVNILADENEKLEAPFIPMTILKIICVCNFINCTPVALHNYPRQFSIFEIKIDSREYCKSNLIKYRDEIIIK